MALFNCAECGASYSVDNDLSRRTIKCRECLMPGKVGKKTIDVDDQDEPLAVPAKQPSGLAMGFGAGCGFIAAQVVVAMLVVVLGCGGIVSLVMFGGIMAKPVGVETERQMVKPAGIETKTQKEPVAFNLRDGAILYRDIKIELACEVGLQITYDIVERGGVAGPFLKVWLRVTNVSKTRNINYAAWHSSHNSRLLESHRWARIEDQHGNSYRQIYFGLGSHVKDQPSDLEQILPDHFVTDLLLFDSPIPNTTLTLTLPLDNVGLAKDRDDHITITIPPELIAVKTGG